MDWSSSEANGNEIESGGRTNQTTNALIAIQPGSPEVPISSSADNCQSRGSCTRKAKFKCGICKQQFAFFCMWKRHRKDKHGIDSTKSFGCRYYRKTFYARPRLNVHRKLAHSSAPMQQETSNEFQKQTGTYDDDGDDHDVILIEEKSAESPELTVGQRLSEFGKRHELNIARYHEGYYCICNARFSTRRKLDGHLKTWNDHSFAVINRNKTGSNKSIGKTIQSTKLFRKYDRIVQRNSGISERSQSKAEKEDPAKTKIRNEERGTLSVSHPTVINIEDDEQANTFDPEKHDGEEPSSSVSLAIPNVGKKEESMHAIDTTKKGYSCICTLNFTQQKSLIRHIRRMTEKWNFMCYICEKPFFQKTELHRHFKQTHKVNLSKDNKTFGCIRCGDEFKTLAELLHHAKYLHKGKGEEQKDDKRVATSSSNENFGEFSSKNQISLSTPRKRWIQDHQEIMHGKDISRAQLGNICLCGKNLKSRRGLYEHVWYHTKERNVPCPICDRNFISRSYVKVHMERAHRLGKDEMKLASS